VKLEQVPAVVAVLEDVDHARAKAVSKATKSEPDVRSVMGRKNCGDSLTKFRPTGAKSINGTQPGT